MKQLLTLSFLLFTVNLIAQNDVKISYEQPDGRERIVNSLNEVQLLEIISNDKNALKKKFALHIVRFNKGVADTVYSNGNNCTKLEIPVIMANGDSAIYLHDPCKSLTYSQKKRRI